MGIFHSFIGDEKYLNMNQENNQHVIQTKILVILS